jgi:hypothetical protein
MIADLMPFLTNGAQDGREPLCVVATDEERGFRVVPRQQLE